MSTHTVGATYSSRAEALTAVETTHSLPLTGSQAPARATGFGLTERAREAGLPEPEACHAH